jgi:hypothetical protein
MTAVTFVSDVCCVGLYFLTKGSDLTTDIQFWFCKFQLALAPADFFLFPCLKSIMKGARFADVAAIQERVTAVL